MAAVKVHVYADRRPIPDGTGLRSVGAAVLDLQTPRVRRIDTEDGPLDRSFEGPALVILVDGMACSDWGRLHPYRISSVTLAFDGVAAAVRAHGAPAPGGESDWLRRVLAEGSQRAFGVSFGTLLGSIAIALVRDGAAWIAHAGDVVACVADRGSGFALREVTRDHTLLRQLREQGGAELDALDPSTLEGILTKSFGWAASDTEVDVCRITLEEGDVLVLAPRSLVRDVLSDAPREPIAPDWARARLEEAAARETRSPVVLVAQRRA